MLLRPPDTKLHRIDSRRAVAAVYSDVTGRRVGTVVVRDDGNDLHMRPETVRTTAAEIEQWVPLNDFRRSLYEAARAMGMGHDEAVHTLFRDGRITA